VKNATNQPMAQKPENPSLKNKNLANAIMTEKSVLSHEFSLTKNSGLLTSNQYLACQFINSSIQKHLKTQHFNY